MSRGRGRAEPEEAGIVELSRDGQGVARIDGREVLVPDALPGERVLLQRTRRQRAHDEAVLLEVRQASSERVAPECPHFGICAGCALQHLSSPSQLAFKQGWLLEALARLGGVQPERVLEPLSGPLWRYRRRARLGAKYVLRKERVVVGFRERSAPYVADLRKCLVLASPADTLIEPLAELIQGLSIANRVPQVEVAVADEVCALVLRVLASPSEADLARLRSFEGSWPVKLYLQDGGPESIAPLVEDGTALHYSLPRFNLQIAFEPTDFVQVNAALNESMIDQALALLGAGAGDTVLDLYSGLGNFSLPIAVGVGEVTGVEGDAGLVARARGNALANGIANASFHVADLSADCSAQAWASRRYDRVLLDPPRAGAEHVLDSIAATGAPRVVYVSCNGETLARDAGRLVRGLGFRLVAAGVMDMFPHTIHTEAMAVFER